MPDLLAVPDLETVGNPHVQHFWQLLGNHNSADPH